MIFLASPRDFLGVSTLRYTLFFDDSFMQLYNFLGHGSFSHWLFFPKFNFTK